MVEVQPLTEVTKSVAEIEAAVPSYIIIGCCEVEVWLLEKVQFQLTTFKLSVLLSVKRMVSPCFKQKVF